MCSVPRKHLLRDIYNTVDTNCASGTLYIGFEDFIPWFPLASPDSASESSGAMDTSVSLGGMDTRQSSVSSSLLVSQVSGVFGTFFSLFWLILLRGLLFFSLSFFQFLGPTGMRKITSLNRDIPVHLTPLAFQSQA